MATPTFRNVSSEYVAECFWPGVREADLEQLDERVGDVVASSADIRYRGSMLMPEDEVVFCFFGGPSAGAVRRVAERAGIPFERIVASTHFVPQERRARR